MYAESVTKKIPDLSELFLPLSIRQKTVVADTHESRWKDVEKESAAELHGVETHGSHDVSLCVVFPMKTNLSVLQGQDPLIGDSDSMGVAGQVFEDLLGASEWFFGVDNPLFAPQSSYPTVPTLFFGEILEIAKEGDFSAVIGLLEVAEELTPENTTQNSNGEEEVLSARDPLSAFWADASSGDHTMDVGMVE